MSVRATAILFAATCMLLVPTSIQGNPHNIPSGTLLSHTQTTGGTPVSLDITKDGHYLIVGDWRNRNSDDRGVLQVFSLRDADTPTLLPGAMFTDTPGQNELQDVQLFDGNMIAVANDANGVVLYELHNGQLTRKNVIPLSGCCYATSMHAFKVGRNWVAYVGMLYGSTFNFINFLNTPGAVTTAITAPNGARDVYSFASLGGNKVLLHTGDGGSWTRLEVMSFDHHHPEAPQLIGSLALPGPAADGGLPWYPGVGGDVQVHGGYAYVVEGQVPGAFRGGVHVVDVHDPTHPTLAASLILPEASRLPWRGSGVEFADHRAFIVGVGRVYVIDIKTPTHPTILDEWLAPSEFGTVLGGRAVAKSGYLHVTFYGNVGADGTSVGGIATYRL